MFRRSLLSFALLASLGCASAQAADSDNSDNSVVSVTMDQAKIARIPENAQTLVIGNPIVADVTMLKGTGAMVVTGKGFGETNLIVLNAKGDVLDEKTIRVVPSSSTLLVQRGTERESYSCAPKCMPAVQLGDGKQFSDASAQITQRNSLATPPAAGQANH